MHNDYAMTANRKDFIDYFNSRKRRKIKKLAREYYKASRNYSCPSDAFKIISIATQFNIVSSSFPIGRNHIIGRLI